MTPHVLSRETLDRIARGCQKHFHHHPKPFDWTWVGILALALVEIGFAAWAIGQLLAES